MQRHHKTDTTSVNKPYPILSTNKMNLIHNEETDILDVLPLFPSAGQNVPLIWGANDDVTFSQQLKVSAGLSSEYDYLLIQTLKLLMPIYKYLHANSKVFFLYSYSR